jgi:hypothetical protein
MNRKHLLSTLFIIISILLIYSSATAQDKIPITPGEWIQGELSNDDFEVKYTFDGTQGQIVTVAMMPDWDASGMDVALVLRDSDGDVIGQNDDIDGPHSLVVAELPSSESYIILATRAGDSEGEGLYWLQVNVVQPLSLGLKETISIVSEDEKQFPRFYVIRSESSASVKFGFNENTSGIYPLISLFRWNNANYAEFLFRGENLTYINNLAFNASLEANAFYILEIDPIPVFRGSEHTATLAFAVG